MKQQINSSRSRQSSGFAQKISSASPPVVGSQQKLNQKSFGLASQRDLKPVPLAKPKNPSQLQKRKQSFGGIAVKNTQRPKSKNAIEEPVATQNEPKEDSLVDKKKANAKRVTAELLSDDSSYNDVNQRCTTEDSKKEEPQPLPSGIYQQHLQNLEKHEKKSSLKSMISDDLERAEPISQRITLQNTGGHQDIEKVINKQMKQAQKEMNAEQKTEEIKKQKSSKNETNLVVKESKTTIKDTPEAIVDQQYQNSQTLQRQYPDEFKSEPQLKSGGQNRDIQRTRSQKNTKNKNNYQTYGHRNQNNQEKSIPIREFLNMQKQMRDVSNQSSTPENVINVTVPSNIMVSEEQDLNQGISVVNHQIGQELTQGNKSLDMSERSRAQPLTMFNQSKEVIYAAQSPQEAFKLNIIKAEKQNTQSESIITFQSNHGSQPTQIFQDQKEDSTLLDQFDIRNNQVINLRSDVNLPKASHRELCSYKTSGNNKFVNKSISDFLNQRINLSQVKTKNEWLNVITNKQPEEKSTKQKNQGRKSDLGLKSNIKKEEKNYQTMKRKSLFVSQTDQFRMEGFHFNSTESDHTPFEEKRQVDANLEDIQKQINSNLNIPSADVQRNTLTLSRETEVKITDDDKELALRIAENLKQDQNKQTKFSMRLQELAKPKKRDYTEDDIKKPVIVPQKPRPKSKQEYVAGPARSRQTIFDVPIEKEQTLQVQSQQTMNKQTSSTQNSSRDIRPKGSQNLDAPLQMNQKQKQTLAEVNQRFYYKPGTARKFIDEKKSIDAHNDKKFIQKFSKLREPSKSVLNNYDLPFTKHTAGIEPIMEFEANFEQTQKCDILQSFRKHQSEINLDDDEQNIESNQQDFKQTISGIRNLSSSNIKLEHQSLANKTSHVRSCSELLVPNSQIAQQQALFTLEQQSQNTNENQHEMSTFYNQIKNSSEIFNNISSVQSTEGGVRNTATFTNTQTFIPKTNKPRVSMADLQKEYQNKCECFIDFYRNVKSYTNYDRNAHLKEFLKKKAEEEAKRKEATQKTHAMFYESLLGTKENHSKSVMSVDQKSHRQTQVRSNSRTKTQNIDKYIQDSRKSFQSVKALQGLNQTANIQEKQQQVVPPTEIQRPSTSQFVENQEIKVQMENLPLTEIKTKRTQNETAFNTSRPSQTFSTKEQSQKTFSRKKSTPNITSNKTPLMTKRAQPSQNQQNTSQILNKHAYSITPVKYTGKQEISRTPHISKTKQNFKNGVGSQNTSIEKANQQDSQPKTVKAVESQKILPFTSRFEGNQSNFNTNLSSSIRPQSTLINQETRNDRQAKKQEIFNSLKNEMTWALKNIGINDQSLIWDEKFILQSDENEKARKDLIFLSRQQVKRFLINLKYLNEDQLEKPSSPRGQKMYDKLHKLEAYQFDDLIQMLSYRRYCMPGKRGIVPTLSPSKQANERSPVVSIYSVISFVFIMNEIIRDWMLIKKRRSVPKPKFELMPSPFQTNNSTLPQKKLSKIEQRLLGINYIMDKEKQYLQKSVLQKKKHDQAQKKKYRQMMQEAKKLEKSSSSDEDEDEVIEGDYFLLRKKREVGMIKEQFSYLLQNRVEQNEVRLKSPTKSKIFEMRGLSHSKSQVKLHQGRSSSAHNKIEKNSLQFKSFEDVGVNEFKLSDSDKNIQNQTIQATETENQTQGQKGQLSSNNLESGSSVQGGPGPSQQPIQISQKYLDMPLQMKNENVTSKLDNGQMSEIMKNELNQNEIVTPKNKDKILDFDKKSEPRISNKSPLKENNKQNTKSPIKSLLKPSQQNIGKPSLVPKRRSIPGKQQSPLRPRSKLEQQQKPPLNSSLSSSQLKTPIREGKKMHQTTNNSSNRNTIVTKESPNQNNKNGIRSTQSTLRKNQTQKINIEDYKNNSQAYNKSPQKNIKQERPPESLSRQQVDMDCPSPMPQQVKAQEQKDINPAELQPQCLSESPSTKIIKHLSDQSNLMPPDDQGSSYQDNSNYPSSAQKSPQPTSFKRSSYINSSDKQPNINKSEDDRLKVALKDDHQPKTSLRHELETVNESPEQRTNQETTYDLITNTLVQSVNVSPEQIKSSRKSLKPGEEPILIVDIKLIKDKPEKIVVMENDVPEDLVEKFCQVHTIDNSKRERLLKVIKEQIQEYYREQESDFQMNSPEAVFSSM